MSNFTFWVNRTLFAISVIIILQSCNKPSEESASEEKEVVVTNKKTQVALLGVFHFGGSSGDLASMQFEDPFSPKRQAEIKELVERLRQFQPTKILVEYPRYRSKKLQTNFDRVRKGKDSLGVNEIDQLGYRLAMDLGMDKVYPIDHKLNLPAEDIVEYCQRNDKMGEFQAFIKGIQDLVAEKNEELKQTSLVEFISNMNTEEEDRLSNDLYLNATLEFGDSINEAGAHFSATWWERNMIILKNIDGVSGSKDDRLLVIIGAAHRAVLKDMVLARSDMNYVEIGDYLRN